MSPSSALAFEPVFHGACRALLRGAGVTPAYHAREYKTFPAGERARVVVEASGFLPASGHRGRTREGRWFLDHRVGQLTYTITTPRDALGTALHDGWLGRIRDLHQFAGGSWAGLPYRIIKFTESPNTLTYINEGERDRSELIYAVEFSIPATAMDFSTPAAALPVLPP